MLYYQHQRNINDEQIKSCADTGGVIGINGMGIFLGDNDSVCVMPVTVILHFIVGHANTVMKSMQRQPDVCIVLDDQASVNFVYAGYNPKFTPAIRSIVRVCIYLYGQ